MFECKTRCDQCGVYVHGSSRVQSQIRWRLKKCCAKFIYNPDYTQDVTPETSMEVDNDDYHSNDSPLVTREEADMYLTGSESRRIFQLDPKDDISPNATSNADEEDKRSNTPGMSDDVSKLILAE